MLIRSRMEVILSCERPEEVLNQSPRLLPWGRQSVEAPFASKNRMNRVWPRCAARESAVSPKSLVALTSAPREMSSSPMLDFPSTAANMSGVQENPTRKVRAHSQVQFATQGNNVAILNKFMERVESQL